MQAPFMIGKAGSRTCASARLPARHQAQPAAASTRSCTRAKARNGSPASNSGPRREVQQRDPATTAVACSRRASLPALGLALLSGAAAFSHPGRAAAEEGAVPAAEAASDFVTYSSPQGYSLERPASWEQVSKAGADVLFCDPAQKSTSVGVTVYPVTISSLGEFGDLAAVGKRLLDTERAKESTLGVEMLSQQQRASSSGPDIYQFVYRLESTRGTKQIFDAVTVTGRKLYILNGSLNCGKGESSSCSEAATHVLQRMAQSFSVP